MTLAPAEVEITPGEIWESTNGKHVGLRVAVLASRGQSIKVKVIRNQGANGAHKMTGQIWSIDRQVFVARYKEVNGLTVATEKPRVETDLSELLKRMPPTPPMPEPLSDRERRVQHAHKTLQTPEAYAKRKATLDARVAALTPAQVEEIVQLLESGTHSGEIASAYRVGSSDINRVVTEYRRRDAAISSVVLAPTPPAPPPTREDKISNGVKLGIERQFEALSSATKFTICQERLAGATYWHLLRKYKLINGVLKRVLEQGGVPTGKDGYHLSRGNAGHRSPPKGESPTPVVPEILEPKPVVEPAPTVSRAEHRTLPIPKDYVAKVWVMEPVLKTVELEAVDFESAVELAKAIPHITKVVGVSEAY